jgi:hypothetical protein
MLDLRWMVLILVAVFASGWPGLVEAQTATLRGDVYLVTRGGEVRQGAANEVALIPRSPDIEEGWVDMCARQREAFQQWDSGQDAKRKELEALVQRAQGADEEIAARRLLQNHLGNTLAELGARIREEAAARAQWIRSAAETRGSTGMQAHYQVQVAPGDYWVFAEMRLGEEVNRWLVPIALTSGAESRVDLDNNNLLGPTMFGCDHNPFEA